MKSAGQVFLDAMKTERDQRFWRDVIMGTPAEQECRRRVAAQAELWRAFHDGRTMGKVEA